MSKVLVPLAQGCEELEAISIIDILRRAEIEVTSVGLDSEPIVASRGARLLADCHIDEIRGEEFQMIVLPGGQPGSTHLADSTKIIELLKSFAKENKFTCAICAAPAVLAKAGLLEGKQATAYPGTLEKLTIPGLTMSQAAVVVDDKVITSRGPGTAMDFALQLVEVLKGKDIREKVEAALVRDKD